jgi:hypothetical protein
MDLSDDIKVEIKKILNEHELQTLKDSIKKRKKLNCVNTFLIYNFHIAQTLGILITTIAAGYNIKLLVWIGVGMNCLATLINVFEQTNNNISSKLLNDIKAMTNGTFIGESNLVDPETKQTDSSYQLISNISSDAKQDGPP